MERVKLVLEVGINHNGDIDLAKKIIDAAVMYDYDFVKFQKRHIPIVYLPEELDKPRESQWGTTTRDQKMGLEFGESEYDEIDAYCKIKGIRWFASPWDPVSVNFLKKYNMPYIKVPSALITNFELLAAVKNSGIPVIISTGMSEEYEVDDCVEFLGDDLSCIMACCSTYPSTDEDMNLTHIKVLKAKYGDKYDIGFSNHHPGTFYCTVAPALGATWVEMHGTAGRHLAGSDQSSSIEFGGMRIISDHIRSLEKAMGSGSWGCRASEVPVKAKLRFNTYRR